MQFFTLYTPATPMTGRMDEEHMAAMAKLTEAMTQGGTLIANGALMSRTTGMKVLRRNGHVTVDDGPVPGSTLMPAAGYAVLKANSREELLTQVKKFLEVAGDGTVEVIQALDQESEKPRQTRSQRQGQDRSQGRNQRQKERRTSLH